MDDSLQIPASLSSLFEEEVEDQKWRSGEGLACDRQARRGQLWRRLQGLLSQRRTKKLQVKNGAGEEFALKAESSADKVKVKRGVPVGRVQLLPLETRVLRELNRLQSPHACLLAGEGSEAAFDFIVMTLVGGSLQDLKKQTEDGHLSLGSAVGAALQCLQAIQDLHKAGERKKKTSDSLQATCTVTSSLATSPPVVGRRARVTRYCIL